MPNRGSHCLEINDLVGCLQVENATSLWKVRYLEHNGSELRREIRRLFDLTILFAARRGSWKLGCFPGDCIALEGSLHPYVGGLSFAMSRGADIGLSFAKLGDCGARLVTPS